MNTAKPIDNLKQQYNESLFFRMIVASVGLHIAVVSFFTVKTFFFPSEAIDYQSAIRVDMVALPEKGQQLPPAVVEEPKPETPPVEAAKPQEKEPEKVAEKPKAPTKPKVDLKSKKKEKSEALDKIKALAALESISDEVKKESEEKAEKERPKPTQVKGNILSKGGALKGIVSNQLAGYISQLEQHAKENWTLPQWLADLKPQPKAKAAVFIDENGVVIRRMIVESSGNATFDELILAAIDRSSPFPIPPVHFVDLVKVKGIQLNFPD